MSNQVWFEVVLVCFLVACSTEPGAVSADSGVDQVIPDSGIPCRSLLGLGCPCGPGIGQWSCVDQIPVCLCPLEAGLVDSELGSDRPLDQAPSGDSADVVRDLGPGDLLGDVEVGAPSEAGCGLLSFCRGACVDLLQDLQNCGSCGTTCNSPHSLSLCILGRCRSGACDPGYGDCDPVVEGCETSLSTSDSHCGSCGHACVPPHGRSGCTLGTCHLTSCDPGYGDCDNNASNGCELALATDPNHCGACNQVCSIGTRCVSGQLLL